MFFVHECVAARKAVKPVVCPKCRHGRICDIPAWGHMKESPRGKPPPSQNHNGVIIKCPTCGTRVSLIIE